MKAIKISGIVIKGDGYGRTLGFPTMNLGTTEEFPMGLKSGVYSGTAVLDNQNYRAGILINPEKEGKRKVEAHLIGYAGDAYGKTITLNLEKFLRDYKKFETEQELIAQIEKDLKEC